MVTTPSRTEQRRSRRFRTPLVVDLHAAGRMQRHLATDVGRHGLFVVSEDPPAERHLVKLTMHLPHGPIDATAAVSRRIATTTDGTGGMGLQFFVISSEAKRRWDAFLSELEGRPAAAAPQETSGEADRALFFVKLKDQFRLREFFDKELRQGVMELQTPVLRPVGSVVHLVVVHPGSSNEFTLRGMVMAVREERPRHMTIHFEPLDEIRRLAFMRFIETGETPALPPPPPPAPPPDAAPLIHGQPVYELDLTDDAIVGPEGDDRFSWEMANEASVPVIVGHELTEELTTPPGPVAEVIPVLELSADAMAPLPPPAVDDPPAAPPAVPGTGSLPPSIAAAVVPPLAEPAAQHADGEVVDTEVETPPPPSTETTSSALTRLGVRPGIRVQLHCTACRSADTTFEAGQPDGPLALFAERKAFWCPGCKIVVSALAARSAYQRRRVIDELGGSEGGLMQSPVPLKFAFEVAALQSTPACPYCQGKLKTTKQIKSLHKRVAVLLSQDPDEPLAVTRCPVCTAGKWMVQRAR